MDSALKQRLLGAAVLIALAVIFVPMFLSGTPPKQSNETVNLDIPAPQERKFETRTLPLSLPSATPIAAAPTPPVAAVDPNHLPTVDTSATPVADKLDSALATPTTPIKPLSGSTVGPAALPAVKPSSPAPTAPIVAATDGGRFNVNLGIYADQSHADTLLQNVKKLGLPVNAEAVDYQGKPAQRVRVGPFADRASAEAARLKIKAFDGKLPLSISEIAATPTTSDVPAQALPVDHAGGWAVQLGAFKSEDEANKLRDRCRGAGFAAFVDHTGTPAQTLWRVRAGPEVDRVNADKLRGTIKQKMQIDGMLVTQP